MVVTLSDLISYFVAFLLLLIMYKKVIAPFAKRMLDTPKDDFDDLEYLGITFDDIEVEEDDKEEELRRKLRELKKKMNLTADIDEENLRYEALLKRLQDMTSDDPQSVTKVLTDLSDRKERL